MLALCRRLRLELEDWLRYDARVRHLLGRIQLWRCRAGQSGDPHSVARATMKLCAAARLVEGSDLERRIQERIIEQVAHLDAGRLDWTEFVPDFKDGRIFKAAILKPHISPAEKGVLFVAFESQWIKLLASRSLAELANRYTLVIAPSSSPHNLINYVFPASYPEPIFTLISNPQDGEVLPRVSSRLIVVPLYASNWVNPDLYVPVPRAEREYDLIMVASWGKVKRHHAFFSALRSMPKNLRIMLVGQDQEGRSADTIREVARWYDVQDRFTILGSQPYREVARLFCLARASVILSKREGSCVVVAESMFADTPVAVLRDAKLGSRVFINGHTGCFLDEANFARDLTSFIQNADHYQPRAWAEQNISCWRSSTVLNDFLRHDALARGHAWTQDIAPLHWTPDPLLARPEDRQRLAAEREDFRARFGLEIGPAPVQ